MSVSQACGMFILLTNAGRGLDLPIKAAVKTPSQNGWETKLGTSAPADSKAQTSELL